jgi:hypothetical protein
MQCPGFRAVTVLVVAEDVEIRCGNCELPSLRRYGRPRGCFVEEVAESGDSNSTLRGEFTAAKSSE